jgi:hypothetical protein
LCVKCGGKDDATVWVSNSREGGGCKGRHKVYHPYERYRGHTEQSVVVELGRQASFWRSASGRVVGGGFSGGLSEGAAGVVVGGLGRVGYRRQDGVRLALLFLERQHSHVELRANSVWLGKRSVFDFIFCFNIYFQI